MKSQLSITRKFNTALEPGLEPGYAECEERRKQAEAADRKGDIEEAIRLYELNLDWCKENLTDPSQHFLTIIHQNQLAGYCKSLCQYDKAVGYYEDVYRAWNELDPDSAPTMSALGWYAWVLTKLDQYDLAAGYFEILLKTQEKALSEGDTPFDTLSTTSNWASCFYHLAKQGKSSTKNLKKATELHESLVDKTKDQKSITLINNREDLAKDYIELGKYEDATSLLKANLQSIADWKTQNHLSDADARKAHSSSCQILTQVTLAKPRLKGTTRESQSKTRSGGKSAGHGDESDAGRQTKKASQPPDESTQTSVTSPRTTNPRLEAVRKESEGDSNNRVTSRRSMERGKLSLETDTVKNKTVSTSKSPAEPRTERQKHQLSRVPVIIEPSAKEMHSQDPQSSKDTTRRSNRSTSTEAARQRRETNVIDYGSNGTGKGRPRALSVDSREPSKRSDTMRQPSSPVTTASKATRNPRASDPAVNTTTSLKKPPSYEGRISLNRPDATTKCSEDNPQISNPREAPKARVVDKDQLLSGTLHDKSNVGGDEEDPAVRSWFDKIGQINRKILGPFRKDRERRVRIAVLDSGVEMTNPQIQAFKKRIKRRQDFSDPQGNAVDNDGHGTCCVALVLRVAPEADIYVGKIVTGSGHPIDEEVVAKAIEKALKPDGWNVDIVSLSFGFTHHVRSVNQMLEAYADVNRKIVLAAASNDGNQQYMTYPASRHGVIAVNAATGAGSSSQFNPPLVSGKNLSIIGEMVQSAWVPNTTRIMSGTSIATPIAAGVAALLLEIAVKWDSNRHSTTVSLEESVTRYDGITALLNSMSPGENKDHYRNIIPWILLEIEDDDDAYPGWTLLDQAAQNMRRVLKRANGLHRIEH